ncbi:hypothetical protein BRD06_04955 [Halobacteriales archaeon QS_9_67_15]|nr:MAG: hypothetical protein BRD06_04955 [Halobacteriales archaeon QS_9_67_15]
MEAREASSNQTASTGTIKPVRPFGRSMRSEDDIRERIAELEDAYDRTDPPTSEMEDEAEVAILRAIEELEWVLEQHDAADGFTT